MADKATTAPAASSTTTATADTSDFSSSGSLDSLLSGDGEPIGITPVDDGTAVESGTETETPAEQTVDTSTESETETPTEDVEETETPGAEEEETEFTVESSDRDYSQTAYERAAKIYGKKYGKEFDLANASDKALLHDLIEQREQANERGKAAATAEETEETPAETPAKVEPKALTPEQMVERLNLTYQWAEKRVVPEVAQNFASKLVTSIARAIWPDKNIADLKLTPELAAPISQMLLSGVAMSISEVLPAIMNTVPNAVRQHYPMIDRMHSIGIREAALEKVGETRDQKGNLAYPDLDTLVDSGSLKRAMKSIPGFAKMHFSNDPVEDYAQRIALAYKVARGSSPDPAALSRAAKRGAEKAREADNRGRSGRLTPGGSKGTFGAPRKDAASTLMAGLAGVENDAFGAAVARDTAKK